MVSIRFHMFSLKPHSCFPQTSGSKHAAGSARLDAVSETRRGSKASTQLRPPEIERNKVSIVSLAQGPSRSTQRSRQPSRCKPLHIRKRFTLGEAGGGLDPRDPLESSSTGGSFDVLISCSGSGWVSFQSARHV